MNNITKIYKYMLIYLYSYTSFSLSIYQHSNNPEKKQKGEKEQKIEEIKTNKNNKAAIVRRYFENYIKCKWSKRQGLLSCIYFKKTTICYFKKST